MSTSPARERAEETTGEDGQTGGTSSASVFPTLDGLSDAAAPAASSRLSTASSSWPPVSDEPSESSTSSSRQRSSR